MPMWGSEVRCQILHACTYRAVGGDRSDGDGGGTFLVQTDSADNDVRVFRIDENVCEKRRDYEYYDNIIPVIDGIEPRGSSENKPKPSLAYVIRGFLYNANRIPISW